MSTTLTTVTSVSLSNAGHPENQSFDFGAVLGLKGSKTTNGITYRFEAAENTISQKGVAAQGVLGPYVELSTASGKPMPLESYSGAFCCTPQQAMPHMHTPC